PSHDGDRPFAATGGGSSVLGVGEHARDIPGRALLPGENLEVEAVLGGREGARDEVGERARKGDRVVEVDPVDAFVAGEVDLDDAARAIGELAVRAVAEVHDRLDARGGVLP